jgi:DUF177 domain-containing protein
MSVSRRSSSHLDARSPFVVDSHELGRRAGSMLELQLDRAAPADWQLDLVEVPAGASIQLDLRLESVMDGVLVSAQLQAPIRAECGRCLQPVTDSLDVSWSELYAYEPDPDDEDLPVIDGDLIDLEPALRDAVVLALPLNPVCREDCAGLCPTCGARLDDVEPGHAHERTDPRWDALSALQPHDGAESATMDRPAPPSEEN